MSCTLEPSGPCAVTVTVFSKKPRSISCTVIGTVTCNAEPSWHVVTAVAPTAISGSVQLKLATGSESWILLRLTLPVFWTVKRNVSLVGKSPNEPLPSCSNFTTLMDGAWSSRSTTSEALRVTSGRFSAAGGLATAVTVLVTSISASISACCTV